VNRLPLALGAVWFVLLTADLFAAETSPLRLVQTIRPEGVEGRIDHMTIDVAGQRLFIAALSNNSVEVVDLLYVAMPHRDKQPAEVRVYDALETQEHP
jgi:hypothetical protein